MVIIGTLEKAFFFQPDIDNYLINKHIMMLWVLIRSSSLNHFVLEYPDVTLYFLAVQGSCYSDMVECLDFESSERNQSLDREKDDLHFFIYNICRPP